MESALYLGTLRHRRFRPREHSFEYPVFMSWLDVDAIADLMRKSPFSSYERWNVLSYFERDHFGDPTRTLRERLSEDAQRSGVTLPDGRIFLLTHLRYFGYVFNPVSFFYFYDGAGKLCQMMSEVNNTFGESHNYWLTPSNERRSTAARRYSSEKRMHVSPFMGMNLSYDWIFTEPGEHLLAHMNTISLGSEGNGGKPLFDATLRLERRPWTRSELHRTLAAYPFMTASVIGGIHWQALKLWLKHVPVFRHSAKRAAAPQSAECVPAASSKGTIPA